MSEMPRGIAYPLYERVKREMALQGWTATRLRKESGIARSTLNKWETQPRVPLAGTVLAVADALRIDRESALRLAGILPALPEMSQEDRRSVLYGMRATAGDEERRGA